MFKFVCAAIGYYLLGFLGAIIGFFIGGAIDRNLAYGAGAMNPLTNNQRQQVFIETLFLLKGKLAKADGHISKAEIDQTEQIIKEMNMTAERRQIAIDLFKKGSAADFNYLPQLQQFMTVCGNTHHLKQMLVVYLIVLALADGHVDAAEEALLKSIAQQVGFNETTFRQLMEMVINQSHFAGGQGGKASSASMIDDAYKALGVTKNQTDQEIKRAYRKLMSQYHPDKLIGQGLPEDMIKVATEKAKEIQVAYDLIKEHRSIK